MSDQISLTGTVHELLPVIERGNFRVRTLVVDTGGKYPQTVPVEFTKDKIDLLDSLQVGQSVRVGINIRGREWNGKYYASLSGWRIEADGSQTDTEQQSGLPQPDDGAPDFDDIPF